MKTILIVALAASALSLGFLASTGDASARGLQRGAQQQQLSNRSHTRHSCWRWTNHGWVNVCYR
jgi:hypothetical protein